MMTKYRSVVLLFALLLLGLTACGGEKTKKEVDHPTVRLQAGEKTYEEKVYSYCWPETAANVVCKTNYDVREQPSKIITVASGDSLHLLIDEKYGTPQQVTTTVLNGPGGQQALGATTDGVYLVALENGAYQLQVDVTYSGIEGRQTYVSYIFGLDVQGGSLAALPSPTPVIVVATAEAIATTEPTEEAVVTSEPTEEVVAESTEEPAATSEPTEEAVVAEPTETLVQKQTAEPTLQPVIKASPTKAAVVPSNTPAAVAVQPTATRSIPTATPTTVLPTVTQPVPTATQPVPTATQTLVSEVPPTATLPSALPSATLIAVPPTVPDVTLNFAGRNYMPLGYQYCQREASGQRICVELPADNIDPSRITLLRGAAVQLQIDGDRPTEVRIEYLSDTGVATGQPETKRGDNIILFSVMPEPGTYIMTIRVTWQNEDATYYFRVAVSN